MKGYSITRQEEYDQLNKISLDGKFLDVGGAKSSNYQDLIAGDNSFYTINIDESLNPDMIVDVERKFPFDDESFDHAICMNVIEHVFKFDNCVKEQVRCVKKGGKIIIATPFMFQIHASPDDYIRYTDSAYKRMAEENNCEIEILTPLGFGFFSVVFQMIGSAIPTNILKNIAKRASITTDKCLNKISNKYRTLTKRIPLGYFVVMRKK